MKVQIDQEKKYEGIQRVKEFGRIKNSDKLLGYNANISIFPILLELWIDSSDYRFRSEKKLTPIFDLCKRIAPLL